MSYQRLCVMKINREIIGSELTGQVYDPEDYTYQTQLQNGVPTGYIYVIAWYTNYMVNGICTLAGKEAIFIINTDSQDIKDIPISSRVQVSLSDKWIYYGKSTINNDGYASVLVDREQIGLFAIASYCPISSKGNDVVITLGG